MAAAFLLLAAGCSPSESLPQDDAEDGGSVAAVVEPSHSSGIAAPTPAAEGTNQNPGTVDPGVTPEDRSAAPGLDSRSPLDLAIGALVDPDELSQAYDEAYRLHAESVTRCMKVEGFDYVYPQLETPQPAEFVVGTNSDTELVQRFGYGPPQTVLGLVEAHGAVAGGTSSGGSSGPAYGSPERAVFLDHKARCLDEAANSIRLPDELPLVVTEVIQEFRASLGQSIVVRDIWADWSACMANEGYAFADRTEVSESLYSMALPLQQAVSMTGPSEDLSTDTITELDDLLERESEIVEADARCAESATVDERLATARTKAELQFLEQNGDWIKLEMDSWRRSG